MLQKVQHSHIIQRRCNYIKQSVASFSSDNFAVSSGAVTIKDASVANAELFGSAITLNSNSVSLGGSLTLIQIVLVRSSSNFIFYKRKS